MAGPCAGKGSGSEPRVEVRRRLWVRLQLHRCSRTQGTAGAAPHPGLPPAPLPCAPAMPWGAGGAGESRAGREAGGCGKRDCGQRAGGEPEAAIRTYPGPSGRAAAEPGSVPALVPGLADSRTDPLSSAAFPARSRGAGPGWHLLPPAPAPGPRGAREGQRGRAPLPVPSAGDREVALLTKGRGRRCLGEFWPGSAVRACFAEGWTCSCPEAKRGAGSPGRRCCSRAQGDASTGAACPTDRKLSLKKTPKNQTQTKN